MLAAAAEGFVPGAAVRVVGLAKASQHNNKTAVVSARAASSGRVGVKLDDGSGTLSCRPANLELLPSKATPAKKPKTLPPEEKPRTLKMETQILAEFDGNRDPDLMALYHHNRDQAFDAFNVPECARALPVHRLYARHAEPHPRPRPQVPCADARLLRQGASRRGGGCAAHPRQQLLPCLPSAPAAEGRQLPLPDGIPMPTSVPGVFHAPQAELLRMRPAGRGQVRVRVRVLLLARVCEAWRC